jgi:hypothetical protein
MQEKKYTAAHLHRHLHTKYHDRKAKIKRAIRSTIMSGSAACPLCLDSRKYTHDMSFFDHLRIHHCVVLWDEEDGE